MHNSTATLPVAVACAAALIALSGSAEEPAGPPDGPLELPVPSTVAADSEAIELARLWVRQGRLSVSIRADALADPTEWGAVLAEVARHIANSYVLGRTGERTDVLDRIVLGFETNLDYTPDGLTGGSLLEAPPHGRTSDGQEKFDGASEFGRKPTNRP